MEKLEKTESLVTIEKLKDKQLTIVCETYGDKPYYSLVYKDPTDGITHRGYSSYNFDVVLSDIKEYFEIVG